MKAKGMVGIAAALVAAACVGSEDVERLDTGSVEIAEGFAAGGVFVKVTLDGCLSSSCDVDRQAFCSVALEGDRLVVRSEFSWTSEGNACTADCGSLSANCSLAETLGDGSYVVVHGDDTGSLDIVDGTVVATCFGDPGPFSCLE
jgi:hypothetical protein